MEFLPSSSLFSLFRGKFNAVLLVIALLYGTTSAAKYQAVNLGGWLVIEKYLTPDLFDGLGGNVESEYDLSFQRPDKIKEHHDKFVTEADFSYLNANSINAVRIPVGWWIAQSPTPSPYVDGSLQALDNAFTWGLKHNIKIIVDLHAAPGSQNKDSHSESKNRVCNWKNDDNIAKTLQVIDFLAERYANHPSLLGIELVNEPNVDCVESKEALKKFYVDGYNVVRKYNSNTYVIFCQLLGTRSEDASDLVSTGQTNVVLDIHPYNVFGGSCDSTSAQVNIDCINGERKRLVKYLNENIGGALVLVGEWANTWHGQEESMRRNFSDAQLEVYGEASFGWAYWTLKQTNTDKGYRYWSFQSNIEDGVISSSRS